MPFQPTGYVPQYGNSIAELMLRQGEIAAQGAERQGLIWGNAIQNIGGIAAGAVQQHQEQKGQKKQAAALNEFVQSGVWMTDPQAAVSGSVTILGPEKGPQFAQGLLAAGALKRKEARTPEQIKQAAGMIGQAWEVTPVEMRPQTFQQAYGLFQEAGALPAGPIPAYDPKTHDAFIKSLAPAPPKVPTREIKTRNPDGSERIQIVKDEPGFEAVSSPAPKEPEKLTLDQRLSAAFASGDQQAVQGILALKAREAAATRAPRETSTPEDFSPDIKTTDSGNKFINLATYQGKTRDEARRWANANGVRALGADDATAMTELGNAVRDLRAAYASVEPLLSSNIVGVGANKALAKLQWGDDGAALKAFNDTAVDAAIRIQRAASGGKGLRIQQDLIKKAILSIPNPSHDTADTAAKKLSKLETYLKNVEDSVFGTKVPSDLSGSVVSPLDKSAFLKKHGF